LLAKKEQTNMAIFRLKMKKSMGDDKINETNEE